MRERAFLEQVEREVLLGDGSPAALLDAAPAGGVAELLNVRDRRQVEELHIAFIRAGARVIRTNTLAANRVRLGRFGLAGRVWELNVWGAKVARAAREVAGEPVFIAGTLGPLTPARAGDRGGEPPEEQAEQGVPPEEQMVDVYREQVEALLAGGVDLFLVEARADAREAAAAVRAVRAACQLPVAVVLSFTAGDRTPAGQTVAEALALLGVLGGEPPDLLGPGGALGPERARRLLRGIRAAGWAGPLWVLAGRETRPRGRHGAGGDRRAPWEGDPAPAVLGAFARSVPELAGMGARVIGGTAGVTPRHVESARRALASRGAPAGARAAVPGEARFTPAGRAERPFPTEEPALDGLRLQQRAATTATGPDLATAASDRLPPIAAGDGMPAGSSPVNRPGRPGRLDARPGSAPHASPAKASGALGTGNVDAGFRSGPHTPPAPGSGAASDGHLTAVPRSGPPTVSPGDLRPGLRHKLGREFVVSVELDPPKGTVVNKFLDDARRLGEAGTDCINVGDSPMARVRMAAIGGAYLIQAAAGVETIVHFTTRDRNLMAIQADLLAAHALGLRNILALTGDNPRLGDTPASPVYDVDSIGLLRILRELNQGRDITGNSIGEPTAFTVACALSPNATDLDRELDRFRRKLEAGVDFVMTQPLYETAPLERVLDRLGGCPVPILLGVMPLHSARHAHYLHNEVPGISIPAHVREALEKAGERGLEVGLELAEAVVEAARPWIAGVYVVVSFGKVEPVAGFVRRLKARFGPARATGRDRARPGAARAPGPAAAGHPGGAGRDPAPNPGDAGLHRGGLPVAERAAGDRR